MFPIRDLNPTRITPVLTVTLIAINVFVFFFWQPRDSVEQETEFLYEYAAMCRTAAPFMSFLCGAVGVAF